MKKMFEWLDNGIKVLGNLQRLVKESYVYVKERPQKFPPLLSLMTVKKKQ